MMKEPISWVESSRSSRSWSIPSAWSTIASSRLVGIGRFSQALRMPPRSFLRLNSSRVPSCFTTMYGMSSICSYEVKRRAQLRHSRRRRLAAPSRRSRGARRRRRAPRPGGARARGPGVGGAAGAALAGVDDAVAVLGAEGAPHDRCPSRAPPRGRGLLLGMEGDVEAQQQLLEVSDVLNVDRDVAQRLDDLVLLVLDLEADEDPPGALQVGALERHLEAPGELVAVVGRLRRFRSRGGRRHLGAQRLARARRA